MSSTPTTSQLPVGFIDEMMSQIKNETSTGEQIPLWYFTQLNALGEVALEENGQKNVQGDEEKNDARDDKTPEKVTTHHPNCEQNLSPEEIYKLQQSVYDVIVDSKTIPDQKLVVELINQGRLPNIEKLVLGKGLKNVKILQDNCKTLKSLRFLDNSDDKEDYYLDGLLEESLTLPMLTHFEIPARLFTPKCVNNLKCNISLPNLCSLVIPYISLSDDYTSDTITNMIKWIESMPNLKQISSAKDVYLDNVILMELLSKSKVLSFLTNITSYLHFNIDGLMLLLNSPHLKNLEELVINRLEMDDNDYSSLFVKVFVEQSGLKNLQKLSLKYLRINHDLCTAIATSPYLTNIKVLELAANDIDVDGLKMIVKSSNLSHVREIDLRYIDGLNDDFIKTLSSSRYLTHLSKLWLSSEDYTTKSLGHISRSEYIKGLEFNPLKECNEWNDDDDLVEFLALPQNMLNSITELHLDCSSPQLTSMSFEAFAYARPVPNFTELVIDGFGVNRCEEDNYGEDDSSWRLLFSSQNVNSLRSLTIKNSQNINNDDFKWLAQSRQLINLEEFVFINNALDQEYLDYFQHAKWYPNLTKCDLQE